MATLTAREWRAFYARERATLGAAGLARLLDEADAHAVAPLEARAAAIFPHTRLAASGRMVAAVALAAVRARADEIVALGVLHGAREGDAARVARARAGEREALATLRRVHGDASPFVAEEFSLDGFTALLAAAAAREGVSPPRVRARFPFLVGASLDDLAGMEELTALHARGVPFVATCDPIHHGVEYGTPAEARRAREAEGTRTWARGRIEGQLAAMARGDGAELQRRCAEDRSDFRDVGAVLAGVFAGRADVGGGIEEVELVDYSDVLGAAAPTWVAGARATFGG